MIQQAAEIRLQKEKEILPVVNTSSSIWTTQNISWGNTSLTSSQWSSNTGKSKYWYLTETTIRNLFSTITITCFIQILMREAQKNFKLIVLGDHSSRFICQTLKKIRR